MAKNDKGGRKRGNGKKSVLKSLSSFEWASVSRYIEYISDSLGLEELSFDAVNSFSIARKGPEKLIKSKRKTRSLLLQNRARVATFVKERATDLDENEIVVLRSLYIQTTQAIETVERHIEVAAHYGAFRQIRADFSEGSKDDQFPF